MNEKCGECVKIRRAEIVEEKMLCIQVHKTYSCLCTLCVLRMCDRITAFQFSRIQRKMPNSDNNQKCDIDFCCIAHRCAVTFLDLRALVACCSFSCRICLHAWQKEIRHRRLPHTGISWHSNKLNPICRMHKEWLVWVGCVCVRSNDDIQCTYTQWNRLSASPLRNPIHWPSLTPSFQNINLISINSHRRLIGGPIPFESHEDYNFRFKVVIVYLNIFFLISLIFLLISFPQLNQQRYIWLPFHLSVNSWKVPMRRTKETITSRKISSEMANSFTIIQHYQHE